MTGLSHRLEARGHVRGVPDDRERSLGSRADVADDSWTGVHAYAEAGPVIMAVAELLRSVTDRDGGPSCLQRVIGLVAQRIEGRQDRVTREMLDETVLPVDDFGHDGGPVPVEHVDDLGRRSPLREGREANEVGEQDRHLPLHASEFRQRRVLTHPLGQVRTHVASE